jgi:hypothetical protein
MHGIYTGDRYTCIGYTQDIHVRDIHKIYTGDIHAQDIHRTYMRKDTGHACTGYTQVIYIHKIYTG